MNEKKLLKKIGLLILTLPILLTYYYLSNLAYYGVYRMLNDVFKVSSEFFMKYSYIMDIATYIVMIIPLSIIYVVFFKQRKDKFNYYNKMASISIGLGIAVSGASHLWMILLNKVLINIPIFKNSLEAMEAANKGLDNEGTIAVFLIAVILAPIIEELLFRGIIFNLLEKVKIGWMPILVSSILFGAYHMNLVQAVYTTIMGIVAALIFRKTKNLLYPILMHMANNFVAATESTINSQNIINAIDIFSVIMIFLMAFLLISLKKHDTSYKIKN